MARTLPKGTSHLHASVGAYNFEERLGASITDKEGNVTDETSARFRGNLPQFDLVYRYALTDRVELGGRFQFGSVGIESKVALVRPDSALSGFNLSINPTLLGQPVGNTLGSAPVAPLLMASLPLMMGVRFSGHELTVSPRLFFFSQVGNGSNVAQLYGCGSVGFAPVFFERFRILPEVSVLTPLGGTLGPANNQPRSIYFSHGTVVQFNLGFSFDLPGATDAPTN